MQSITGEKSLQQIIAMLAEKHGQFSGVALPENICGINCFVHVRSVMIQIINGDTEKTRYPLQTSADLMRKKDD